MRPPKKRAPTARKTRGKAMVAGALHPAKVRPTDAPVSMDCALGRHDECDGCACWCECDEDEGARP